MSRRRQKTEPIYPSDAPPFSLTKSRYDMNTYSGRVRYFFAAVNPMQMIKGADEIHASQKLLADFKAGTLDRTKVSDARLWDARMVVDATVHPATNEIIFPLFRFAAFCPVNFLVVPLTLLPSTIKSPARTIGIHWFNQSYNCAVNYANRSSEGMTPSELMPAYVGAVTTSISLGLGGTFLMKKLPDGSSMVTLVRAFVPFTAVSMSGVANLAITRNKEWSVDGVEVKDSNGEVLGRSKIAAFHGLKLCAAARVVWNIPCMVMPPLIGAQVLTAFPSAFAGAGSRFFLDVGLCNAGTALGVPPSLAVFPPNVSFSIDDLEPELKAEILTHRPEIKEVYFYKGL